MGTLYGEIARMAAGLARNAGAFQAFLQDSHQAGSAATAFCASARETTKRKGATERPAPGPDRTYRLRRNFQDK